jgi:hypothetical protein
MRCKLRHRQTGALSQDLIKFIRRMRTTLKQPAHMLFLRFQFQYPYAMRVESQRFG